MVHNKTFSVILFSGNISFQIVTVMEHKLRYGKRLQLLDHEKIIEKDS